jgi:hypothetical protein
LQITAQQPQQSDTQLANIQQIPSTITQTMKEQTPMVSYDFFGENYFLGDFSIQ